MTAPALAPLQVTEMAPGAVQTTDDEILDWVKQTAETTYHPAGTCRMGADPMAVVDARLRVHGIEGLRVADASIMRSEEHTSELQSLMRISYAVFCLKKKTHNKNIIPSNTNKYRTNTANS